MSKRTLSISAEALEAAFDACWLLRDHCKNVIASGEFGDADKEYAAKCDKFIMAYNRAVKSHNVLINKFNKLNLNKTQKKMLDSVNQLIGTAKSLTEKP